VLGVRVRVVPLVAHHDVVVLAQAVGRVGRRQVGGAQQPLAQRGGVGLDLGVEVLLLRTERPALLLQGRGLLLPLLAEQGAHLVGDRADLGAHGVPAGGQHPHLLVEVQQLVDGRGVLAPTGQPGAHGVGLGTDQSDVQHALTVVGPAPAAQIGSAA